MRQTKTILLLVSCGLGIVGCQQKSGETPATDNNGSSSTVTTTTNTPAPNNMTSTNNLAASPTTQPNNTGINARDNNSGAVTAGMQGQNKSDVDITADIRRKVMDAKMSVDAQNVKIISQNGHVTLRGPVNTQDEKDSIGRMAGDEVGAANVDNELEVKPNGQ
jgi:hypothetical protein